MGKIELLQVRIAAFCKIAKHFVIIRARFDDDALRTAIVEKQVMGDRRQPGGYKGLAAETRFSDQYMPAAIEVIHIIKRSDSIFFCPVDLKITKWLFIQADDKSCNVRICVDVLQIGLMFGRIALFAPGGCNHWFVHPPVEAFEVAVKIHCSE